MSTFYISDDPTTKRESIDRYISICDMITHLENIAATASADVKARILSMPHFLNVQVYGTSNVSIARELRLNRLYVDLGEAKAIYSPYNYIPANAREDVDKSLPVFEYEKSKYFSEHGRSIDDTNDTNDTKNES
jgi:hypothetical protein